MDGELTVAAAASLSEPFERIGADVEAANPGMQVTFTFDSSTTLVTQILEGAPVDVIATADEDQMARLVEAGALAAPAAVFATNGLVIVTEPGNPAGITGLADLADLPDGGVVALCAEQAPCGRYAAEALASAGVSIPEDRITRGQNVTATLAAVRDGDAVAGVVYASDVVRAGDAVTAVPVDPAVDVTAHYPIAVLADAVGDPAAAAFVEHVLGSQGQVALAEAGFGPP